jgi:hypothetical protein
MGESGQVEGVGVEYADAGWGHFDLFERGQCAEQEEAVAESQGEGQGNEGWSNLEVLSLSGWLSTNAGGEIFALEDHELSIDTYPSAVVHPCLTPKLQTLIMHLPYA